MGFSHQYSRRVKPSMRWSLVTLTLFVVAPASTLAVAESGEVETGFPGKAWVEAAPQSQGVDPERLQAALLEYLGEQMRAYSQRSAPECRRASSISSASGSVATANTKMAPSAASPCSG